VHLLESIGKDLIVQSKIWSAGVELIAQQPQTFFSARSKAIEGLCLPRSWALAIVRRLPEKVQRGWTIPSYIDLLLQTLTYLRFDNPDHSREYKTNNSQGLTNSRARRSVIYLQRETCKYATIARSVYYTNVRSVNRVTIVTDWIKTRLFSCRLLILGEQICSRS
jgi:hypothetical protein